MPSYPIPSHISHSFLGRVIVQAGSEFIPVALEDDVGVGSSSPRHGPSCLPRRSGRVPASRAALSSVSAVWRSSKREVLSVSVLEAVIAFILDLSG